MSSMILYGSNNPYIGYDNILFSLDGIALFFLVVALVWSKHNGEYKAFPGNLFRWILYIDITTCIWKLIQFSPQIVYPATGIGCYFAIMIDTFIQVFSLLTHTILVISVYLMICWNFSSF